MRVEIDLDDDIISKAIALSCLQIMKDMLEDGDRQIPYFSYNEKKESRMRLKMLKAARLIHNYHSVFENQINKDYSNLYD